VEMGVAKLEFRVHQPNNAGEGKGVTREFPEDKRSRVLLVEVEYRSLLVMDTRHEKNCR